MFSLKFWESVHFNGMEILISTRYKGAVVVVAMVLGIAVMEVSGTPLRFAVVMAIVVLRGGTSVVALVALQGNAVVVVF